MMFDDLMNILMPPRACSEIDAALSAHPIFMHIMTAMVVAAGLGTLWLMYGLIVGALKNRHAGRTG